MSQEQIIPDPEQLVPMDEIEVSHHENKPQVLQEVGSSEPQGQFPQGISLDNSFTSAASEVGENDDYQEQDIDSMADDLEQDFYKGLADSVFKTSNRIIDDIRLDLFFILSNDEYVVTNKLNSGLLKTAPLKYAKKASQIKHISYELMFISEALDYAPAFERKQSLSDDLSEVYTIKGLLYSSSEPSLSKTRLYHVKFIFKEQPSENSNPPKDEYHLVNELSLRDSMDLINTYSLNEDDLKELKGIIPELIDEANYVSNGLNKVLRIEISKPEFDFNDLNEFELGPINVRYNKALEKYEGLDPAVPSPSDCLFTLFKTLKGPLTKTSNEPLKTIHSSNKILNSNLETNLLFRKLNFKLENGEFVPPDFSNWETDIKSAIKRESYIRKILEIMFLGRKAYSGGKPNKFASLEFSNNLDVLFHTISDPQSVGQNYKPILDEDYITLSAFPFFSDDLIIACYQCSINSDPNNLPLYFDSLKSLSTKRHNYRLSTYVANLSSLNIVGQKEIDSAYRRLSIDPEHSSTVDDDLLITMYQTESKLNENHELRQALIILSNVRRSEKLKNYLKYEPLAIDRAYNLLEIDTSVDDDVVKTAYLIRKSDSPNEEELLTRAFISISLNRKSFELLSQIEEEHPDFIKSSSVNSFKEACDYLGVEETASDLQILSVFQMGIDDRDIEKARCCLRIIGQVKKSLLIDSFLLSGKINHDLLPAEEWPVGLNNIGNTCYLNSLLQYYFSIKPLRDEVLNFNDVYSGESIYKNRRIGGRIVEEAEIERSFQFIYQLRDLFYQQIHSNSRCVTPKKELAFLAFLASNATVEFEKPFYQNEEAIVIGSHSTIDISEPQVEATEETATTKTNHDVIMIDEEDEEKPDKQDNDQNPADMKSELEPKTDKKSCDDFEIIEVENDGKIKAAKISDAEMEATYEIGSQQDVTECIGNVLSQIEAAMKPQSFDELDHEQVDLIKNLFYGKSVQHLVDVNNPSINRDKLDRFSNLFVNITDGPKNIYEAFDANYINEEVNIDGGKFIRTERIVELPQILQVQIQRVYYDRELQRPYKSTNPLSFPTDLYMDRYLDTKDPEIIGKHKEIEEWKSEIATLSARKDKLLNKDNGMSIRDSIITTKNWLEENESLTKSATIDSLNSYIKKIDDELLSIYRKIEELEYKINHNFDKFQKHGYTIFAIFIHRGEANYGHYWIYIRDFKKKLYRKYNDEIVSEVGLDEVFNFNLQNNATPYFITYIKKGCEDQIEPLHRVIELKNNNAPTDIDSID